MPTRPARSASLDLSVPVFSALTDGDLDIGVVEVIWGFTGNSSSSSVAPSAAGGTSSAAMPSSSTSDEGGWFGRRALPTHVVA